MLQLVGQKCSICHKKIQSILEGRFCPECDSPIHNACAQSGLKQGDFWHCPACGTEERVAEDHVVERIKEQVQQDREVLMHFGIRNIGMGIAWIFGGTLVSLFCTCLLIGVERYVVAAGAVCVGVGQITRGIIQVIRALR